MSYSNKVIDHYENPRNVGTLDKEAGDVGTGLVGAPACGDVMKLQLRIGENGVIEDAKFKTFGCGSAIASSSLVTEWVKGMTVDQAMEVKNSAIAEELNLPPVKIHCSVLAEDAIKAAIADYKKKKAHAGPHLDPLRPGPLQHRGGGRLRHPPRRRQGEQAARAVAPLGDAPGGDRSQVHRVGCALGD